MKSFVVALCLLTTVRAASFELTLEKIICADGSAPLTMYEVDWMFDDDKDCGTCTDGCTCEIVDTDGYSTWERLNDFGIRVVVHGCEVNGLVISRCVKFKPVTLDGSFKASLAYKLNADPNKDELRPQGISIDDHGACSDNFEIEHL